MSRQFASMAKSPLKFNGSHRVAEPRSTFKNPLWPNIELKLEGNADNINSSNPFSIYTPEQFNNPIGDAYDTDRDFLGWISEFKLVNANLNWQFVLNETPATILSPGSDYAVRLINKMQMYYIFVVDETIERLSVSSDPSTRVLLNALLANTRDVVTGREKIHDLTKLNLNNHEDLELCLELEQVTSKVVDEFRKVLTPPILEQWFLTEAALFDGNIKEQKFFTGEAKKQSIDDVLLTRQLSIGFSPHVAVLLTEAEIKYLPVWSPLMELGNAICCLDNCVISYPKELNEGAAVLNSVETLMRVKKSSPEDAVAEVIKKRNAIMEALVVSYERAINEDCKSAIWKVGSVLVGITSLTLNSPSRYGWINQRRAMSRDQFA